jgi:hypothetical protein
MERVYRASNGLFFYAGFLVLDAVVLAVEAVNRLRGGQTPTGVVLAVLAAVCAGLALLLALRWGRLRIAIAPETLTVTGDGPARHIEWADVERVRELRGPAYQLSLQGYLPGPYLPHGLVRGETVLEIVAHPGQHVVIRRALVAGYPALQQDVLRSVSKDTEIDLHARWWRE